MKVLGLFVLIFCICFIRSKRNLAFVGKQIICKEFNKKYFYNLTCGIKLVNRNKQTYSVHASFKPVVIQNVHIRMKTYYKFRTEYRPLGVLVDDDVCSFLNFFNGSKMLSALNFKHLQTEQLLNLTCPLIGPRNFTFNNFELGTTRLPDFADIGDWIFESLTYTFVDGEKTVLANIKNYFGTEYVYTNSKL